MNALLPLERNPLAESPLVNTRLAVVLALAAVSGRASEIATYIERDPRNVRIILAQLEDAGLAKMARTWELTAAGNEALSVLRNVINAV